MASSSERDRGAPQDLRTDTGRQREVPARLAKALGELGRFFARHAVRTLLERACATGRQDRFMEGGDAMPSSACSDERLTYEDLLRMPDDGLRHEIIDGVHYVTASPNLRHQQLLG